MKKRVSIRILISILALLLLSTACNLPQRSATPDIAFVVAQTQTAAALESWLTATAAQPQTVETQAPQPVETQAPASPAQTTAPAASPTTSGPTPTASCSDKAKFLSETIPDESTFSSGQAFTKTWTLQNVGTCTWSPEYTLVLDRGEALGSVASQPLGMSVAPNASIEIRLNLTTPETPGKYEGYWMIQNERGEKFGLGKDAKVAFWVKIVVLQGGASSSTTELGEPDWQDSFDDKRTNFYLGADDDISFAKKDGNLEISALRPAGDQWRVAELGALSDFYLEAQFTSGNSCSGKDSYGLIVRAPDQADNIIDSGYIIGISCDGRYRFYRMDNGSYTGLINWTAHPAILKGPNQDNTLSVQAKNFLIQVFVNGVQIFEFSDSAYPNGYFGLVVRAETNSFTALVRQMAFWRLP